MGNITIPNHILEKIKALPWVRVSHLYEQEMIDFGYPRESVNNSEEYGSKIAEQNNVDFSWTKFLIPKGWVDVGLLFNKR